MSAIFRGPCTARDSALFLAAPSPSDEAGTVASTVAPCPTRTEVVELSTRQDVR